MADTSKRGPRGGKTIITARGLVRTVVYLHPDERKALKMAAVERGVATSEVVREAMRSFLWIEDEDQVGQLAG